jgi:hypothetical protein
MIIWARELDLSVVVTNVILTGYFIVGALLEERKLLVEFPETYKEYLISVTTSFTRMCQDIVYLNASLCQDIVYPFERFPL